MREGGGGCRVENKFLLYNTVESDSSFATREISKNQKKKIPKPEILFTLCLGAQMVFERSSVSDPYSLNPDPDPAKNLNPDPDPDPGKFFSPTKKFA